MSPVSQSQIPTSTSGWTLVGTAPDDGSGALVWKDELELPKLADHGTGSLIPGSDGSGEVVAIGSHVTRFKPTDRVIVVYYPNFLFGAAPTYAQMSGSPGSNKDSPGTFRHHGVFNENGGLIHMPSNLSYSEAATLPCSALTAWNALHGLKPLKAGEYVLAQGTGGVSLFAMLFALKAGAVVIATTSSDEKARRLKEMGVQHVLSYKQDPNWGETATKLTRGELGCQRVIEVGGAQTIKQSFECVARGGEIDVIGFLTGQGHAEDGPTYLEPLLRACTVRGIEVGNWVQFEEMNRAIEAYDIRPVVDGKVFGFGELREAYKYVWDQKHFGKVVLSDGEQ
ncbi:NAD(P)-binding protein [Aspergillus costaricaensis CBS 115574]|uniref:NAD(P)-binding protein n=1 Tax=Aspergillus costaricaensis CBS 115574 TaxID=1448317 RepID=A0ACD1IIS5_9EURO|nr:NAD(P)-binding protein [Aspergillus costaricaensis CBS 115574]RAK90208.1 NAD(P)-binding protein [Aspergillus costaricaensis CBS 115574]